VVLVVSRSLLCGVVYCNLCLVTSGNPVVVLGTGCSLGLRESV